MSYTITQFHKDFPDEDACLKDMFERRFPNLGTCPKCSRETNFYKVRERKCYACQFCGHQIYPLAGTIFHKSPTSLVLWFFAIFLFAASRNGVSAKELQRQLGVTYKTAWRMAMQIRELMDDFNDRLNGTVEADETYIGGRHSSDARFSSKTTVIGAVERKGRAKAMVVPTASRRIAEAFIDAHISEGAELHTDESPIYKHVSRKRAHEAINHARREYARNGVTTNSIEGFWSQLKRSLDGTYHCVSPKHLQRYVNEFEWRYNQRHSASPMFLSLLARV